MSSLNQTNMDNIHDKASIIDSFFTYTQAEQQREINELLADVKQNQLTP